MQLEPDDESEPPFSSLDVSVSRGPPIMPASHDSSLLSAIASSFFLDDCPKVTDWIPSLPALPSVLDAHESFERTERCYVNDGDSVLANAVVSAEEGTSDPSVSIRYRRAGPRALNVFAPCDVRAVIVTCGGISPGVNVVIRELVNVLYRQYGCTGRRQILGASFGYEGLYSRNLVELTPATVEGIHRCGGTVLGTSRGGFDLEKIADAVEDRKINQVYIIGGDGSQRGALLLHDELRRRGLMAVVAGIPKTIDNDIYGIDKSFGFDTAVEEALRVINAAKTEAQSLLNGIAIVRLMGRQSGFIAREATHAVRLQMLC